MSIQLMSSPPFALPGAASPPINTPYHASFSLSQYELTIFASSSGNASSRRLPSWVKIAVLNSHYRLWPPSPDCPTLILHCYKKVISTLVTLLITQLRLYFSSSLPRAPHHQSFTPAIVPFHRRLILIVPPHNDTHDDEQPSFTYRTTYQYVNLRKKIFWKLVASHEVIN
jgi:hypothetical protein